MLCTEYAEIGYVVEQTTKQMSQYLAIHEDKQKLGGYFTLMTTRRKDVDKSEGAVILMCEIHTCSPIEKARKYFALSHEKANRLFNNPDNVSSWQSRNPSMDKWGGAIRTQGSIKSGLILSFSGFPELADEAIMIHSALGLGWIDVSHASMIAEISDNPYYGRI